MTLPPTTNPQTPRPSIPDPPLAIPVHTPPATAHAKLNVPSSSTTSSLPRIASLNFSTNGILVWFLSFQKFAICTRERYAAAAFATPAQMSNFVVARLGIMTRAVDVRKLSSSLSCRVSTIWGRSKVIQAYCHGAAGLC